MRSVQSNNQAYTKSMTNFPGVHNLPTCLKMAKAGPSAAWPRPFYQHTSVCKNTKLLTNWLQEHLHQYSLLLLDQSFNCLTPDLVILFTKSLTVSKVDQWIKHHSKTQIWTVLEGDTPGGRAWETIWTIGSQGTFTKLWTPGAVPGSSELLGRGMRCVTASANRTRREGT